MDDYADYIPHPPQFVPFNRNDWRDCGEGPWETEDEAIRFAESEVGGQWCTFWDVDGFRVLVRKEEVRPC